MYKIYDLSDYTKFNYNVNLTKALQLSYADNVKFELKCPLMQNEFKELVVTKRLIDNLEAPINKGKVLGNIIISVGDEILLNREIHTSYDIEKKNSFDYIKQILKIPFK